MINKAEFIKELKESLYEKGSTFLETVDVSEEYEEAPDNAVPALSKEEQKALYANYKRTPGESNNDETEAHIDAGRDRLPKGPIDDSDIQD